MSASALAASLFAAYNEGDLAGATALYAEDALHVEVADQRSKHGPVEIAKGLGFLMRAFPNAEWRVTDIIGDEGRAAVTYRLTGSLAVQLGPFEPRGQRLSLDGVMILEASGDTINRSADYWDSGTFAKQMAADRDSGSTADGPSSGTADQMPGKE